MSIPTQEERENEEAIFAQVKADYALGKNTSGLLPVEYKILIEPEEVEQKSAGGIVLALATTEKEKMAQVRGRLIAVGGNAFEDWKEPIPKVGDKVYYAKYAGITVKGQDGRDLRLANDKDLTAIVNE